MSLKSNVSPIADTLLSTPGELAKLIALYNWSSTPLGSLETWPQSLITTVGLILRSHVPMVLLWGDSGVMIYNDAYSIFAATRHPRLLGSNVREGWPEVADFNDNVMKIGLAGGTLAYKDQELTLLRHGLPEQVWMNLDYSPVPDESGQPAGVVAIVVETTEKQGVQRALKQSEEQFRTLAEAVPNQVWTAPASGKLDWMNRQAYNFSGAAPGTLVGDAWMTIVHPDDLMIATREWSASIESGATYEVEFRLKRNDGVYRWHLARAMPLRDGVGHITRWVGTNTDIHERKIAADEKGRDRDRMWAMSQDVLLICDFEGRITAVNPSATRLLGWSEEEIVGQLVTDLMHPDDIQKSANELGKLSQGFATLNFENRYRHKDGCYKLLDWTAVPDGSRIHAVGRDITEQRTIEEALRQSQKMEAVGQLTGGIAHDFNNLLQGIMGSLEVIRKRVTQGRVTELDNFITGAMTASSRASALTHRLLAFSRRQPLDPRPTEVNPLISSMGDLLQRTLGEHIQLQLILGNNLWLTRCDHNQLESAILNIVINARDAMPDGGKLIIETDNAHLDAAYASHESDLSPGRYVCIAVTDTGTGMPPEIIARAFEPFFTTKPLGQGTGLGLSMIYGFARQSEGFAKIYSEVGRGTTFKLYLPRYNGNAEEEVSEADAPPTPVAESGETVLVVEDEPIVRALVVEVLSELGYRIIEAGNGAQGLEFLNSNQHIDLLDIGLPGLNGRQMVEDARKTRPNLKVLFMTGYAENAAIASGFLEPGMAMITKPFAMDDLANRIKEILEST